MRSIVAAIVLLSGIVATQSAIGQDALIERQAFERAKRAAQSAGARAARLETAARNALDAAARLRAETVAVAARIQAAEAAIDAAEAQVVVVNRLRATQRARLADKQQPTLRLVAALQTMARRPPALALLQPGSVRDMVHVHAVLASVLPIVQARTADLRADIDRGILLRKAAETALAVERSAEARLVAQRRQLVALEARKRLESSGFASSAIVEQDRAMAMGEQARDIAELMSSFDAAASTRTRLASLPGPIMRPAQPSSVRSLPDDAAVRTAAIPAYRLPVVGQVVTGLGEISATGIRARGLTISTRPGAQVVAPTSGRIAFAGPFRAYGNIVVIDHGVGWTTLLTNLAALDVRTGDTVDQGAPIGRAGTDRPTITVELRRRGAPVDIAKLAG